MPYSGPHLLDHDVINRVVTNKKSPGTYYIGRIDKDKGFVYVKIGRDDVSANTRLHSYVNNDEYKRWTYFKFCYWATPREAFEEESRVFHKGPGPKNEYHPARPDSTDYPCPVSDDCFDS